MNPRERLHLSVPSAKQSRFRKGGREEVGRGQTGNGSRRKPPGRLGNQGFCPPSHMSKASFLPAEMLSPASWRPHSLKDDSLPSDDRSTLLPVEKEIGSPRECSAWPPGRCDRCTTWKCRLSHRQATVRLHTAHSGPEYPGKSGSLTGDPDQSSLLSEPPFPPPWSGDQSKQNK